MSTRATYKFKDEYDSFTVYGHCDGYPEGAAEKISNALKLAWPLPRFEADEFAAAFIAANKDSGGNIYCTKDHESHGGTQYQYNITCEDGVIMVECYDFDSVTKEPLEQMLKRYNNAV